MMVKIAMAPKGEEKEMKKLVDKLRSKDELIAQKAQEELVAIGHPKATEAIIKFALTNEERWTYWRAMRESGNLEFRARHVLGKIGKPAALHLINCFYSESPKLRYQAIYAFCQQEEFKNVKEAVPVLIQILEKEGPEPQRGEYHLEVVAALRNLGDERAIPALKDAFHRTYVQHTRDFIWGAIMDIESMKYPEQDAIKFRREYGDLESIRDYIKRYYKFKKEIPENFLQLKEFSEKVESYHNLRTGQPLKDLKQLEEVKEITIKLEWMLKDEWGNSRIYMRISNEEVPGGYTYKLSSFGPDGKQGTDDDIVYKGEEDRFWITPYD